MFVTVINSYMELLTNSIIDGVLYVVFYGLLLLTTLVFNFLRFGRAFRNKHFESISWLGPRTVFRIGNYFTLFDGVLIGVGCLCYAIFKSDNDSEPFDFYLYYELLYLGNTYGVLFTFFFTITTVKNQLSKLLPNSKSKLTYWFDGINSLNVGLSVISLVSNVSVLVFAEVMWQAGDCFQREAAYTSTVLSVVIGSEFALHFFFAFVSMILFVFHLLEIFKMFSDHEFKSIKYREVICSIIILLTFITRTLYEGLLNVAITTKGESTKNDVFGYYSVYEDYRTQFLHAEFDWITIIITEVLPLFCMQMMVDYPF
ncbi:Uncharacterized protein QTN25_002546 [Entamoeba marina]